MEFSLLKLRYFYGGHVSNEIITLALVKLQMEWEWLTWEKYTDIQSLLLFSWQDTLRGKISHVAGFTIYLINDTSRYIYSSFKFISLYSIASHRPIFNFLLMQLNIDSRSSEPANKNLRPKMSQGCYLFCYCQVRRWLRKSFKSYGCFQILYRLGCEPCHNIL